MKLPISIPLVALASVVRGIWIEESIDDTELIYTPSETWTQGKGCQPCVAKPEERRVFNGTWHDTSFNPDAAESVPRASARFNGTYVSVRAILVQTQPGLVGRTDLAFLIDGDLVGSFFRENGADGQAYEYDVEMYKNDSLILGTHTITVRVGGETDAQFSLMLIDRVIYGYNDGTAASISSTAPSQSSDTSSAAGSSSSSSGNSAGVIVPAVIVPVLFLLCSALAAAWFFRQRRRQQREDVAETTVHPYTSPSSETDQLYSAVSPTLQPVRNSTPEGPGVPPPSYSSAYSDTDIMTSGAGAGGAIQASVAQKIRR